MSKNNENSAQPTCRALRPQQQLFEIEDYSFDIEQTLNIGSQSTGAGAGKITFNPFSITRKIDRASPMLFEMACSGTAFKQVSLGAAQERRRHGQSGADLPALRLQAGRGQDDLLEHDDESRRRRPTTFEYGGMLIRYCQQNADGTLASAIPGGWNGCRNIQDHSTNPIAGKA